MFWSYYCRVFSPERRWLHSGLAPRDDYFKILQPFRRMWMWSCKLKLVSAQISKRGVLMEESVAYLWQISAEFPGSGSKGYAGFDTVVLAWSSETPPPDPRPPWRHPWHHRTVWPRRVSLRPPPAAEWTCCTARSLSRGRKIRGENYESKGEANV